MVAISLNGFLKIHLLRKRQVTKILQSPRSIGQATLSLQLQIGLFLQVPQTNPSEIGQEISSVPIKIGLSHHLNPKNIILVVEVAEAEDAGEVTEKGEAGDAEKEREEVAEAVAEAEVELKAAE